MSKVELTLYQALEKKKILEKRVNKVRGNELVGIRKKHIEETITGVPLADVKAVMEENLASSVSLVNNYITLKAAINEANAVTKVTIAGKEYTIANAIARYRGLDNEEYLYRNMLSNVVNAKNKVELTNQKYLSPESISKYVSNILGDSKKDEALIAATEKRYREANEVELYDPLDTEKLATEKIEEIELFREEFHSVSTTANCNTVITVEFVD